MERSKVLQQARKAVCGREEIHGPAHNVINRIAELWTTYTGRKFYPSDVCAMMALMKCARVNYRPDNADHWIDIAGYAALGAEMANSKLIAPESAGGSAGAAANDPVLERFPSEIGENDDCMMDDE